MRVSETLLDGNVKIVMTREEARVLDVILATYVKDNPVHYMRNSVHNLRRALWRFL